MRRLWLHIGSHKTGTTTVQDTFLYNKSLLQSRGLSFMHGGTDSHLHRFLAILDKASLIPHGFSVPQPRKFAEFMASAPGDVVFGSSENFSFLFRQAATDALAKVLQPLFDEVRIIVYLRRQDRHAISHHQEGARPERQPEGDLWGHALTALPQAMPHQKHYLDYDRRVGFWENSFGHENVTVRLYDRKYLKNGDIVPDILATMGIDDTGLQRLPDKNMALGMTKAKVGHLSNAILGDDLITRSLLRALPQKDEKMLPSAEAARAFLEPYREGNRRLNARFGVSAFPDLFPDDFEDYPEVATDNWSDAAANSALRTVMAVMSTGDGAKNALTLEDMRNAALALQHSHPEGALRFAQAAQRLRPNGPVIVRLIADLEARIASAKAN